MTKTQIMALKPGERVNHKRYGPTQVVSLMPDATDPFGVILSFLTPEGHEKHRRDAGITFNANHLERNWRNLEIYQKEKP